MERGMGGQSESVSVCEGAWEHLIFTTMKPLVETGHGKHKNTDCNLAECAFGLLKKYKASFYF